MKRTLTAAATLLAGSAAAVGFAGTAAAAEAPELPAELPVDNNVAGTVYHAASTLHSASGMVGDVVPVSEQLAGRDHGNGDSPVDTVGAVLGGALGGGVVPAPVEAVGRSGDEGDGSSGGLTGVLPLGGQLPIGGQLPLGEQLPVGQVVGSLPIGG